VACGEGGFEGLADFGFVLERGDLFRGIRCGFGFQGGAIGIVALGGVIEPFSEGHLAIGEAEGVFVGGHGVGRGFEIAADVVEVALGDGCGQVVLLSFDKGRDEE